MVDPKSKQAAGYICSDPFCPFAAGVYGIAAAPLHEQAPAVVEPPPPTDPTPWGKDDPLAWACPECQSAEPKRDGLLLRLPELGSVADKAVSVVRDPLTGMFRSVVAGVPWFGRASDYDPSTSPKSTRYTVGAPVVVGQVLPALPYDGHVLSFGNQDLFVGKKWDRAAPAYGPDGAPPLSTASDEPTYLRELQQDLCLLGYFSKSRGKWQAGRFGTAELGAVLALKQDLRELYGIGVSPSPVTLSPGEVVVADFDQPIAYQGSVLAPALLVSVWAGHVSRNRAGVKYLARRLSELKSALDRAGREKAGAKFDAKTAKVAEQLEGIIAEMNALPFRWVLERPTESYAPFEPRSASVDVTELAGVPTGSDGKPVAPAHATAKSLLRDPVFHRKDMGSRSRNRAGTESDANRCLTQCRYAKSRGSDVLARTASVTPPADATTDWASLRADIVRTCEVVDRFVELIRFYVLNLSTQMEDWFAHLIRLGSVDQATAVYIKAMRAGAPIGPHGRAAYRLPLNPDDFANADEGATFIREQCIARGPNEPARKIKTMPEVLALQFFANESGMTVGSGLSPFNLDKAQGKIRFVKMGLDMNSARRGVFDAVNTLGEAWATGRGWGLGQETEGHLDDYHGVELRYGLPVVEPGQTALHHPLPFTDKAVGFRSVLERKALSRFRGARRDCTFEADERGAGAYYDCRRCLERFFERRELEEATPEGNRNLFVPRGKRYFGDIKKTTGVFLDLERVTAFARAGGQAEDLEQRDRYLELFGVDPPAGDDDTLAVLRTEARGPIDIRAACASVIKAAGTPKEDRKAATDALEAKVVAYMDARSHLPCSWSHVRIRYAGTGDQAYKALQKMLRIVGRLDVKAGRHGELLAKHIEEASALRRKAAGK